MSIHDREKWDARYRERDTSSAPSSFLTGLDAVLPRCGRALDVAGGSGRHALWLARRGLTVTLADVSEVALEQASRAAREEGLSLATLQVDLEEAPLPDGPWDLIVCTYFLHRPLFAAFPRALAPGGWLAFAHATRKNLERCPRPGPAYVLAERELVGLVRGLRIIRFAEGWFEEGRHEARLVAQKEQASIGSCRA
ncbi:MAG: SAM-dependent methyltransferase [Anaeromyxobacter sp. RBG_16_69_14]|nr:MAG: SAM-dependent methyltransferase [Anaeromyxobacter sp. RBG_16_69_14]